MEQFGFTTDADTMADKQNLSSVTDADTEIPT